MIGKETTGEQPIFTCKAHVFHIDPKTKRSWLPASASSITVSFFYDSARSLYRIISVEGTKAVINSTVTPAMTFTKTSQKFGQWSDMRANTVYGLGFSSENELTKFIEKFQEVKEATRIALGKTNGAGPTTGTHGSTQTGANASPITSRSVAFSDPGVIDPPTMQATTPCSTAPVVTTNDESADVAKSIHQRSQSFTQSESPKHQTSSSIDTKPGQIVSAGMQQTPPAAVVTTTNSTDQLRYENDRLKLALAHSSANARKWEIELSTLKNNNIRLTSALQESTANVDEWKRQLQFYKDENQRLRNKYVDLEASKTGTVDGTSGELTKDLLMMRLKVETLEIELNSKDEEIKKLAMTKNSQDEKCKLLMQENAELQAGISLAQTQLDTALAAQESQRRVMDTLNTQLGMRIQELAGIHREIALALQT